MKIVSISLFGNDAGTYSQYLKAFVRGHLNLFPIVEGWQLRVHTDGPVAASDVGKLLRRYAAAGLLESRLMYRDGCHDGQSSPPKCRGMAWRLDPVFEDGIEYVFCRDLDAPPMPRDRACCDQFMLSKATVHTIHDSDQHIGIMGGLCGFWAPRFRSETGLKSLDEFYAAANALGVPDSSWGTHGADQHALNRICLRRGGPLLLEHRYDGWLDGPGKNASREAGSYACEAWSKAIPYWAGVGGVFNATDAGDAHRKIVQMDHLGAHLGCAGYDHEAAVKFWDASGNPEITGILRECEK